MKAFKWFLLVVFMAVVMFPQVTFGVETIEITSKDVLKDAWGEINLNGNYVWNKELERIYKDYAFKTFKKRPKIQKIIKKIKKSFKIKDVGTSFPTKAFQVNDGRTLILFRGCTSHNCGGTENVIAYDSPNQKAYVLAESQKRDENGDILAVIISIYGEPDKEVKKVLQHCYLNHQ